MSKSPIDVKSVWDACGRAFDRFTTAADSYSENIERPALEHLTGDISGARALDLGCGSGTYSAWLAGRGAEVTAIDLSAVMASLAKARATERALRVEVAVSDITSPLPFRARQFDLLFTATVLHYVADLKSFFREARRVMKPGARLIASVLHPMSTAQFPAAGTTECETRYFGPSLRSIETPWLEFGDVASQGRRILSYHHTTSDYLEALAAGNLSLTRLCEPSPPAEFKDKNASRYEEAMRVPVYLIFSATARDIAP